MDEKELLDLQQQDPIEVEVVPSEVNLVPYATAAEEHSKDVVEAVDIERERRKSELQLWASKQRLISNAPPTTKQLNRIHKRLKKGYTIVKAINKICSYTTWQKWKEEYPECAAVEEQARQEYIESLLDRKMALASNPGTKMGEIARDKIQMDELQNRIDRIDRLTEVRNKKNSTFGGSVIPIQINVGYGKKTS
jgi:hypothetical protein